jgi:signal peptidase
MTTSAYDYPQLPVRPRHATRRPRTAIATVLCAACLGLAGLVLLPGLLGYERYVITSGSMTGAYDRGSVVFDRVVPVSELSVGDVITYTPPSAAGSDGMLTHRIVAISTDGFGRPVFTTKGDANEVADPWTFTLDEPKQARVAFSVPYVGYALAALGVPVVRLLALGLPALLIAAGVLAKMRRDAREEAS